MTIKVLPEEVILKIAAGEVIERPVSIIKEVIENSVDAGAKNILVETTENSLKIIDDGKGMGEEDLKLCYIRHATSKISSSNDLFNIHSLGFRGEALASISAISRLTIKSKKLNQTANELYLEGSQEVHLKPSSFRYDSGTEIFIEDLFYNTPVRKKFLKTPATEFRLITELISQYIFSLEHISFKLIQNGKTILTSPSGNLQEKFYHIYGKDSKSMMEINYENQNIRLTGLISKPELRRKSRSDQILFVNGRLVRSKMAYAAISHAYKGFINTGEQPVTILRLEIDPQVIDVNIHPTKQEIKFQDESLIYRIIYHGIKDNLSSADLTTRIIVDEVSQETLNYESKTSSAPRVSESTSSYNTNKTSNFEPVSNDEQTIFHKDEIQKQSSIVHEVQDTSSNYIILGIFNKEFILVEKEESNQPHLIMVDFHAAAEITNYEKLNSQYEHSVVESQTLVEPIILDLPKKELQKISEHLNDLKRMGLFIEEFGDTSLIIRSIPIIMGRNPGSDLIRKLLENITSEGVPSNLSQFKDKVITKMSCIASEKAGQDLTLPQAKKILDNLFQLQGNKYNCPHGRPTIIDLSKKDLEKMFKRII